MRLPLAPAQYSQTDQQDMRSAIERNATNVLRADRDVVLATGVRIITRDTVTGAPYSITVVSGVLTLTAL